MIQRYSVIVLRDDEKNIIGHGVWDFVTKETVHSFKNDSLEVTAYLAQLTCNDLNDGTE